MKYYHIGSDKFITAIASDPAQLALVFAISFPVLQEDSGGRARTALSIAHHIADAMHITPVFIDGQTNSHIEKCICNTPASLLVSINLPCKSSYNPFPFAHDRLLTIGANDFRDFDDALSSDIVLNPSFNPVSENRKCGLTTPPHQIVIDYTCAPPHIREESQPEPKTIAAYIRSIPEKQYFPQPKLFTLFEKLAHEQGYKFLVSSGPSTPVGDAEKMRAALRNLPGSEFYNFNAPRRDDNPLVEYFRRAQAIIVSNNTVSGLSDAEATGKPVFLYTTDQSAEALRNGVVRKDDANYLIQLSLLQQGRIQILTQDNLTSDWKPPLYREWEEIGKTIANVIRERQVELATPKMQHFVQHQRAVL